MMLKPSLLGYFLKSVAPFNITAMLISIFFVMLYPKYFLWNNPWAGLFVLVHCIAITFVLGRIRSARFAFVYSRGFSRDVLWSHKMLASLVSALMVWIPVALLIGLGGRSALQNWFWNPYFPIMADKEVSAVWFWLFGYGLLLPMFHYVWIRKAQPTKGSGNGMLLAVGAFVVIFTLMTFRHHSNWYAMLCWVIGSVMMVVYTVSGLLLHRTLEVQK